ncbi:MAG: acetyl-CoA carboxylase carboxyltransferase subunit alpha [Thermomicrobiales bacterium]
MSSGAPVTTWDRVTLARHPQRPRALDFINALFEDFTELHGDRQYRDDRALVGGPARFGEKSVMILGNQKGRDTRENLDRNFGMARPEGYRKAMRLMRLGARFGLPLVTFVDTPGADPGPRSEEHGQAFVIAECIQTLTTYPAPVVSIVIGEGGSGGALAIGVADRILMLENAIYSVASPEASASILWKDAGKAPAAAEAMRISAPDLEELGLIDRIIPEEKPAHEDSATVFGNTAAALQHELNELIQTVSSQGETGLIDARHDRFMQIGSWLESPTNGHY